MRKIKRANDSIGYCRRNGRSSVRMSSDRCNMSFPSLVRLQFRIIAEHNYLFEFMNTNALIVIFHLRDLGIEQEKRIHDGGLWIRKTFTPAKERKS